MRLRTQIYLMRFFYFIICFSILFLACQSNSQQEIAKNIQGQWLFKSGTKNNDSTEAAILKNLTFIFEKDSFYCELLPEMQQGLYTKEAYELEDNLIVVSSALNFSIQSLNRTELNLTFTLNQNDQEDQYSLTFEKQ